MMKLAILAVRGTAVVLSALTVVAALAVVPMLVLGAAAWHLWQWQAEEKETRPATVVEPYTRESDAQRLVFTALRGLESSQAQRVLSHAWGATLEGHTNTARAWLNAAERLAASNGTHRNN